MKPQEIQELIDFISKSGLDEVNIETSDFKISVKKNSTVQQSSQESAPRAAAQQAPASAEAQNQAPAAQAPRPAAPAKEDSSRYIEIKSPMIGTFYRSPNPESEDFVKVGDSVKPGQTVCIVEAMKLFNEIESEVSGTIVKVLVDNSSPVEYDQPLYLVDPA